MRGLLWACSVYLTWHAFLREHSDIQITGVNDSQIRYGSTRSYQWVRLLCTLWLFQPLPLGFDNVVYQNTFKLTKPMNYSTEIENKWCRWHGNNVYSHLDNLWNQQIFYNYLKFCRSLFQKLIYFEFKIMSWQKSRNSTQINSVD